VPGVSERELKTATQKNTLRNQVYMCTIDRQIVRMSGPRPPSPTGKIPKASRKRAGPEAAVEKMVLAKGAGEDEEFVTPPRKRARTEKGVRWDREATLIRAPLGGLEGEDRPATTSSSSALKAEQVPLDAHGNVLERPVEKLKRNKVTVRAVFYDGENPVEFDYNAPPGSTKSKKK
jgi:hypothetical protein